MAVTQKVRPGKLAAKAIKNLFSKPATVSVRGNESIITDSYRGMISYSSENCVACGLCMRDCPTGAIKIINDGTKEERKMRAEIDTARCIFCCQCVDSCAKKCLSSTQNFRLSSMDKNELRKKL